MSHKTLAQALLTVIFAVSTVFIAQAAGKDDITKVREATAQFHRNPAARDAGYELIPGLDYCFQNYGRGGMGYLFINTDLLDTTADCFTLKRWSIPRIRLEAYNWVPSHTWCQPLPGALNIPNCRRFWVKVSICTKSWICMSCMPGSGRTIPLAFLNTGIPRSPALHLSPGRDGPVHWR